MRVAARHWCGPKVRFRRCRTLIYLLRPGPDLRRSTRLTKWPLIDDSTSSPLSDRVKRQQQNFAIRTSCSNESRTRWVASKRGEGVMRFTVRALAILAGLLTMPAAAAGIDSASPGRKLRLSHEVQMPLPKDMAINLGRECRAIVQLALPKLFAASARILPKSSCAQIRITAPLRLVKQAAVNGWGWPPGFPGGAREAAEFGGLLWTYSRGL